MSDVLVPFGDSARDTAKALLDAAGGDGVDLVRTTSDKFFLVPVEVAKKAGVTFIEEGSDEPEPEEAPAPARKTTAKKTAASGTKE